MFSSHSSAIASVSPYPLNGTPATLAMTFFRSYVWAISHHRLQGVGLQVRRDHEQPGIAGDLGLGLEPKALQRQVGRRDRLGRRPGLAAREVPDGLALL